MTAPAIPAMSTLMTNGTAMPRDSNSFFSDGRDGS
jgi:hypothetical protein